MAPSRLMTQLPMDTRRRGAARCSVSALVFSAVINAIVRYLKLARRKPLQRQ
jgi:hypothetical protein